MEKRIKALHCLDNAAVVFSVAAVWGTILMILYRVIELSVSRGFIFLSVISALSVLLTLTVTSAALIIHLKKNRDELYHEELFHLSKNKEAA